MPRSSRSVARRYAAMSRRRRATGQTTRPDSVVEPNSAEQQSEAPAPTQSTLPRVIIASPTARVRTTAATRASTFESTDYTYVIGDLRRVGIVAGALLAALIALSFVLH